MTKQILKLLAAIVALVTLTLSAPAQNHRYNRQPIDNSHSCVVQDSAYLYFPDVDQRGFAYFYSKLYDLLTTGKGQVSILHLGDSHTQAGVITSQLRTNLSTMVDSLTTAHAISAGRGAIFPFKAIKTNAPADYTINTTGIWRASRNISRTHDAVLGLTGAAAITTDPAASLQLTLPNPDWAFTRIRVLGYADSENTYPVVTIDGNTYEPLPNDGQTGYLFSLPEAATSCTVSFRGVSAAHPFVVRGLLPQSDRPGIIYSESGINGATVTAWLRCPDFESELALISPDLVVMALGTNDSCCPEDKFDPEAFKANYRQLINRILNVNPNVAFLFVGSNDCHQSLAVHTTNYNTPRVAQAMRQLVEEYGGCFFNLYETMGGLRSHQRWIANKLVNTDHIHFTSTGYRLVADLIYNALVADFEYFE